MPGAVRRTNGSAGGVAEVVGGHVITAVHIGAPAFPLKVLANQEPLIWPYGAALGRCLSIHVACEEDPRCRRPVLRTSGHGWGRVMVDCDGNRLGEIADIYLDRETDRPG